MKFNFLILCLLFCPPSIFAGEIKTLLMSEVDISKQQISPNSRGMNDVTQDFGITTIGYEKNNCDGPCVTTILIINKDGSIKHVEEKDDAKILTRYGTVNRSAVFLLQEYLVDIAYFDLDNFYAISATELTPPRIFMVQKHGKRKFVLNYGNAAPNKIWALEVLIEHLASTAMWKN